MHSMWLSLASVRLTLVISGDYHNGLGKPGSYQTISLTFWYKPEFLLLRYCDKLTIDRITASKRKGREFGMKAAIHSPT